MPASMVAGHMELMHHYSDLRHRNRWHNALGNYLISLEGQTLPGRRPVLDRIKDDVISNTIAVQAWDAERLVGHDFWLTLANRVEIG